MNVPLKYKFCVALIYEGLARFGGKVQIMEGWGRMKAHIFRSTDVDEVCSPCSMARLSNYDAYYINSTDGDLRVAHNILSGWIIDLDDVRSLERLVAEVGPVIISPSEDALDMLDIEILGDDN